MKAVWKVLLVLAVLWALCVGTLGVGVLWYTATTLEHLIRDGEQLAQNVESLTRDVGALLRDPDRQTSVVRCPDGSIRIGRDHDEGCELIQPLNLRYIPRVTD